MPAFRSKVGTWLVLLTLALQFTLPFAHVDRDELRPCRTVALPDAGSQVGIGCDRLPVGARSHAGLSDGDAAPAPGGLPSEHCILCAFTSLGSPTPLAPDVLRPDGDGAARFAVRAEQGVSIGAQRLFKARAPPPLV